MPRHYIPHMLLHPYPLPGTPLGNERTIVAVVDDDHVKSDNKLIAIES